MIHLSEGSLSGQGSRSPACDGSALKLLSYTLKIQLDNSCSYIKYIVMEMHFTLVLLLVLCAVLPTDGQTERAFKRKHIKRYMTPRNSGSRHQKAWKNQEGYKEFSEKHILSMDIKRNPKVKELKDIFERYLQEQDLCGPS
ncbi:hypothetical protein MHYP_G00276830 [Metynnis hypsauchen]